MTPVLASVVEQTCARVKRLLTVHRACYHSIAPDYYTISGVCSWRLYLNMASLADTRYEQTLNQKKQRVYSRLRALKLPPLHAERAAGLPGLINNRILKFFKIKWRIHEFNLPLSFKLSGRRSELVKHWRIIVMHHTTDWHLKEF